MPVKVTGTYRNPRRISQRAITVDVRALIRPGPNRDRKVDGTMWRYSTSGSYTNRAAALAYARLERA